MKKFEQNGVLALANESKVHRITTIVEEIHITFDERGIGSVFEHQEEIRALTEATANDTVFIRLRACPGGSMDTLLVLGNLLMSTPARTVAVIEGFNCSAATMLPLLCQYQEVTPYSAFMCHTAQSGEFGAVGNVERAAVFNAKRCHEFLEDVYKHFLTEKEISEIKDGKEIYLNSEDIAERLQKRAEILNEEACCCEECEEEETDSMEDVIPEKKPAKKSVKKKPVT